MSRLELRLPGFPRVLPYPTTTGPTAGAAAAAATQASAAAPGLKVGGKLHRLATLGDHFYGKGVLGEPLGGEQLGHRLVGFAGELLRNITANPQIGRLWHAHAQTSERTGVELDLGELANTCTHTIPHIRTHYS